MFSSLRGFLRHFMLIFLKLSKSRLNWIDLSVSHRTPSCPVLNSDTPIFYTDFNGFFSHIIQVQFFISAENSSKKTKENKYQRSNYAIIATYFIRKWNISYDENKNLFFSMIFHPTRKKIPLQFLSSTQATFADKNRTDVELCNVNVLTVYNTQQNPHIRLLPDKITREIT